MYIQTDTCKDTQRHTQGTYINSQRHTEIHREPHSYIYILTHKHMSQVDMHRYTHRDRLIYTHLHTDTETH
jgi:hypothetical protein